MEYSPVLELNPPVQAERKPRLTSHDSGQECSIEHWLEVYKLVEKANSDLDGYVFEDSCLFVSQYETGRDSIRSGDPLRK